jgi:formate dehydrogenase subunit gamma
MKPPALTWDPIVARKLIMRIVPLPGALLPVLHALQDHFGYVDTAAVPLLAEMLNLSRAEVHGVISFYDYFRTTPPGRRTLRICRAEACQAMNGNALVAHAKKRLAIDFHETTRDGAVTLEPVYCLGNCGCAPAIMLDDKLYGRMTATRLDDLLGQECR